MSRSNAIAVVAAVSLLSGSLLAGNLPEKLKQLPIPQETRAREASLGSFDPLVAIQKIRAAIGATDVPAAKTAPPASALTARIGHDVEVKIRPGVGTPMMIKGPVLHLSRRSVMAMSNGEYDVETAREFLGENAALLRISNPNSELVPERTEREESGRTHIRFGHVWRGIPVRGSQLIVHLDPEGNVELLDGAFVPTPNRLPAEPTITAERAMVLARGDAENAIVEAPRLIVQAPGDRIPRLAWSVRVTWSFNQVEDVIIDASDGTKLASYSLVMTEAAAGSGVDLQGVTRPLNVWAVGGRYWMVDTSKSMYRPEYVSGFPLSPRGVIRIADANYLRTSPYIVYSSAPSSFTPPEAVSAAYWVSRVYDYFSQAHARQSYDDLGASLQIFVRLPLDNAYWNAGNQFLCLGAPLPYASALDIIAHEMSHAVTSSTADLEYVDEPGAANEAFSDILGEMAEYHLQGSADWFHGEGLGTPNRSFVRPEDYSQPSKYGDFLHLPPTADGDYGGVHFNSGIINHAFYLLAKGLPEAIGEAAAEKIFYRALTLHLTSSSRFIQVRQSCVLSAEELFGQGSVQSILTNQAFDTVEVFDTTASPPPPAAPPVAANDSLLFLFAEKGKKFVGRYEVAKNDPAAGSYLTEDPASASCRISVSGDGSYAMYVNERNDACFVLTDGSQAESCVGLPGLIASAAMSADGNRVALVLVGPDGQPENKIHWIDAKTSEDRVVPLRASSIDGGFIDNIERADSLDFSNDGRYVFFDALTVSKYDDGTSIQSWTIYAYDSRRDMSFALIDPIPGLQIAYPAVSQTSDRLLTFEALNASTGTSQVYVGDLYSGDLGLVGTVSKGWAVPSFNGDDTAVIFSNATATPIGSSIYMQRLSSNHTAPAGSPALIMGDADFGTIYRRGAYSGPMTNPGAIQFSGSRYTGLEGATSTITVTRVGGVAGAVSVTYSMGDGTANAGSDYTPASGTLSWDDGESEPRTFIVRALEDQVNEGTETIALRLVSSTGATVGSPSTATLEIANKAVVVATPPASPTGLAGRMTSPTTAELTWRDNSNNETDFVAYFSFDGISFENFATLPANATAMGVKSMVAGVPYWFRITARNAAGESAPSSAVKLVDATSGGRKRAVRR